MNFLDITELTLPPQSIECEEAILGGILLDPSAMARVVGIVTPEAFYISQHQAIYKAALNLYLEIKPTDLMSVSAYLSDQGELEKAGGLNKLVQLVERTVSAINIDAYAKVVRQKYIRRQLIQAANEIVVSGYDTSIDIEEVLENAQSKILAVIRRGETTESSIEHIGSILPRLHDQIEQNNAGEEAVSRFLTTGFYDFDEITSGLAKSYVTTCAGRPGMGKTSFAVDLASRVAIAGTSVVYFSLEMPKEDITAKLLARLAAPDLQAKQLFTRNAITKAEEWESLSAAIGTGAELPIWIDDRSSINPLEVRATLQEVSRQTNIGLVVIDYIGLMRPPSRTGNRVTEVDETLKELRAIAKDFNVPILGLAQINRGVEGRGDKRPGLSDIRESGAYEQESAAVLTLYNDAYYNPDTPDRGIIEVSVVKNRFGSTGTAKLLFQPEYGQFLNMQKREAY
jgi:replicative DNA helicase